MQSFKLNPLVQTAGRKIKIQRLKKVIATYMPPAMSTHIDDLKRAFIFGKNQFIGALTTNNLQSGTFTSAVVKQADYEYLILGNFNNYQLSLLDNNKPSLLINPSDLFCKDQLSNYLSNVQSDPNHDAVYNLEDRIFYQMDQKYRQVWTNDYMTAGIYTLDNQEMKVLFGSPSSIVTLEDLMLRFQLGQLEQMYYQVLEYIKVNYKNELIYSPRMIHTIVREIAAQKFKNSLHTKTLLYMASMLRNCAKMGKSNLLFCNRHFVNQVRYFAQKSSKSASSLYRQYLKDTTHPDYQLYKKILKQKSRDEILKKFYLVSQLVDNSALQLMQRGNNVFRQSVFGRMIPRSSASTLINQIYRHSQRYKQSFLDLQTQFISNNLIMSQQTTSKRLTLTQQLELLEDRKIDFPVEYQVHSIQTDQIQQRQSQRLHQMMQQYLKSEHRLRDLELLVEFKKKQYSKQNIILFTKLLGQLKIKTGSQLKLPLHHFKNFSGYFKEVMRDQLLEQKYGVKKTKQPQKPLNIQVRNNVSLEEIQRLIELRDQQPGAQKYYQALDSKTAMERWQRDDDDDDLLPKN